MPSWYARYLTDALGIQPSELTVTHDRDSAPLREYKPAKDTLGLRPRVVCKPCNGGWMRDIQVLAEPILRPLLNGLSRSLSKRRQAILGTWMTMNAMSLEFTDLASTPFFTAKDREVFRQRKKPIAGVTVWIGAYEGHDQVGFANVKTMTNQVGDELRLFTYTIGTVAFQVLAHRLPGTPTSGGNRRMEINMIGADKWPAYTPQIWPPEQKVYWPPKWLRESDLDLLSVRFDAGEVRKQIRSSRKPPS